MAEAKVTEQKVDPRRLLVRNIPAGSSKDLIINYLEVMSQAEVREPLHFQPDVLSSVCLAAFDTDITDEMYVRIQQKICQRLLTEKRVSIERVAMATGILIHDLKPPYTTKDYLELFFEKHIQSLVGEVVKATLHADILKAVVIFSNSEVVEHLMKEELVIKDTKLKMEVYFHEFHHLILQCLLEKGRQLCGIEVSDVALELSLHEEAKPGDSVIRAVTPDKGSITSETKGSFTIDREPSVTPGRSGFITPDNGGYEIPDSEFYETPENEVSVTPEHEGYNYKTPENEGRDNKRSVTPDKEGSETMKTSVKRLTSMFENESNSETKFTKSPLARLQSVSDGNISAGGQLVQSESDRNISTGGQLVPSESDRNISASGTSEFRGAPPTQTKKRTAETKPTVQKLVGVDDITDFIQVPPVNRIPNNNSIAGASPKLINPSAQDHPSCQDTGQIRQGMDDPSEQSFQRNAGPAVPPKPQRGVSRMSSTTPPVAQVPPFQQLAEPPVSYEGVPAAPSGQLPLPPGQQVSYRQHQFIPQGHSYPQGQSTPQYQPFAQGHSGDGVVEGMTPPYYLPEKLPANTPPKPRPPEEHALTVTEEKKFTKFKLELLKQSGYFTNETNFPDCKVTPDDEAGIVRFHGTKQKIVSAQLKLHETLSSMVETEFKLPHSTLLPVVKRGQGELQSALTSKNHCVVLKVEKEHIHILGLTEKATKQALLELQKLVISDPVTLDVSYMTFVETDEWKAFVQKRQDSGLVRIVTVIPKKMVYVNGLKKDVDDAKKQILAILKKNAAVTKTVRIDNPRGKFIHSRCNFQLMKINENLRDDKVHIKTKHCGREFTEVEVTGLKEALEEGVKALLSLEKGIIEFVVIIPGTVTETKLWKTFSTGSNFNPWIEELEKMYNCSILPSLSKSSSGTRPRSSGGGRKKADTSARPKSSSTDKPVHVIPNHDRETSYKDVRQQQQQQEPPKRDFSSVVITQKFGQINVTLKSGDITKERADVLVNVVNNSLDLTRGQVSKTFLRKGDPQMQLTLKRSGGVGQNDEGDVLETVGGGELQCKAVLHVILERYRAGGDSLQNLRSGIQECLQKSTRHRSLAFPTLGCGHLRFPPAPTAKAMMEEIKDFGQNTSSCLQNVTIVVFDQKLFPIFQQEIQGGSPSVPTGLHAGVPVLNMVRAAQRFAGGLRHYRQPRQSHGRHRRHRSDEEQEDATSGPVTVTEQNITIEVKKGNIVTENADLLVNVTNRDLDLSRGRVSQIFLKAGGDELQDEVQVSGKAADGDVVVVRSCGSLENNSKHIANVVLPRYNSHSGLKVLQTVVSRCLTESQKLGVESVAFPSLGCGNLAYPRENAASTMVAEIKKFAQRSSGNTLKVIKIVIYEAAVFEVFARGLRADSPGADGDSVVDLTQEDSDDSENNEEGDETGDDDNNGDEDFEDDGDSGEDDNDDEDGDASSASLGSPARPKPARARRPKNQSHFVVVTFSDDVTRTKSQLLRSIEDKFHSVMIDVKKYITNKERAQTILKKELKHLEGVAQKHSVEMEFDSKTHTLKVQGRSKDVSEASNRMMEILVEKNNNYDKAQYVKKHGTWEEYCEAQVRSYCVLPEYWGNSLFGDVKSYFKSVVSSKSKFVTGTPDKVKDAVQKLIDATWKAQHVGHGRDSAGIRHGSKMQVKNIEMIRNEELFIKYFDKRKSLFRKAMKKEIIPVNKLKGGNQRDVQTEGHLSADLKSSLENEVNEVFLFHGSRGDAVQQICSHGLDFRVATEGGMLGKAVYAAESSTKADQYTDEKGLRTNTKLKMILMRVALGRIFLCEADNPPKYSRPPCVRCYQEICNHQDGHFDSILFSHNSKNFREFVVYHNEQCYPEFLITYDRV